MKYQYNNKIPKEVLNLPNVSLSLKCYIKKYLLSKAFYSVNKFLTCTYTQNLPCFSSFSGPV